MSAHQTGPRCGRILTKKTHTRSQAAIFLYCTTHNALGLDLHRQPSYKHTTFPPLLNEHNGYNEKLDKIRYNGKPLKPLF